MCRYLSYSYMETKIGMNKTDVEIFMLEAIKEGRKALPIKIRPPIFLSKALHCQNPRNVCPSSDFLLNHDISNNPFQSHPYRPLPHTRHPINISINTTPGSQTQ